MSILTDVWDRYLVRRNHDVTYVVDKVGIAPVVLGRSGPSQFVAKRGDSRQGGVGRWVCVRGGGGVPGLLCRLLLRCYVARPSVVHSAGHCLLWSTKTWRSANCLLRT